MSNLTELFFKCKRKRKTFMLDIKILLILGNFFLKILLYTVEFNVFF